MAQIPEQNQRPSKRRTGTNHLNTKSILAVKMLAARTAWLGGWVRWRGGQAVWATEAGETVPDARVLSRTQKCLNKISGFPQAAPAALGDADAWLSKQRERLALAKRLRNLSGIDVVQLARKASRRDPAAIGTLTQMLVAEAVCVDGLPASPCAALAALGSASVAPIQTLLGDDIPASARVLAALTLGAIGKADPAALPPSFLAKDQAYRWGRAHDVPAAPGLAAALLTAGADDDTTGHCLQATGKNAAFGLPTLALRALLFDGVSADVVAALAEAAGDAETVAERMFKVRDGLPERKHRHERQAVSETRRAEQQERVRRLAEMLTAYACRCQDPEALRLGTAFLHKMLDLSGLMTPHSEAAAAVQEAMLTVFRDGLTLPPALQRPYLEILVSRHERFWSRESLARGDRPRLENNRVRAWLHETQVQGTAPLLRLLRSAQAADVVNAAFDRGLARHLTEQTWTDPDFFRLFIALAENLDLKHGRYFVWRLCEVLDTFASAGEARAYFRQILVPLQAFPASARVHTLDTLLTTVGMTRQGVQGKAPRLFPFLAFFGSFAEEEDERCCCDAVVETALALTELVPAEAGDRIRQVVSFIGSLPDRKKWSYAQNSSFAIGLMLATTLTGGDAIQFTLALQTAAHHQFRQDTEQVQNGLAVVAKLGETLRGPLAQILPSQPQRVAGILVRLGLTNRLHTDVSAHLAPLTPQTGFPVLLHSNSAWWRLHRDLPEFTELTNAYRHAQRIIGQTEDPPPGIRRILERPQRTAAELAHLETALAASPKRADLVSRAAKLRALLADPARLREEVRAEIGERLPPAAAEAQVAAIEYQVQACYRARLETLAGPLPTGLVLTDDLINAVLLLGDITENRKLLLRLLRAHLAGEHDWRERHPANQAFLEQAAAQNIGTDVWLSRFPRRYPCEHAPGGWLHLWLENDPLHILQMGNYFGTCLSAGDFNAFSAVANACELNKRVIYAQDGAGNIVGRKLIGLTAAGEMVGFHTYDSLNGEEANTGLREIFQRYAALLASRCNIRQVGAGNVPTLFAERWYDDGTLEWGADQADSGPAKS